MKKIIICGCQGKMGHVLESCIAERDDCEVVAGFDIATEPKKPYPVFSRFADCTVDADVSFDMSYPSSLEQLLYYAGSHPLPLIMATTGDNDAQLAAIH